MTLQAGTRLGPYEVLSPLGAGGMGEVYRARDDRLKRDVAIKVLPTSVSEDTNRLRRFEVEAQAAGGLNHPNITAVYDIGRHEGAPYVVQELLEGETLRAELAGGRIPVRRAISYAIQIAEGLAAAHEKGIVHRDLKPENLFITKDGRVKILDFGLAKLIQPVVAEGGETIPTVPLGTEPGVMMGTVGYMSPEQVRGQGADHRSDIFAFGTVLYEMVSGAKPFRGGSPVETMHAILREDPPELSQAGKEIPPGLERLIRHCLEKSPAQRFQSARDLAYDLGAITETATSAIGLAALPGRHALPRLGWMVVALAVLGATLLAGRWLGLRDSTLEALAFRRLTFRRGRILSARFAPDGKTVAYAASWEGAPPEIFTVRTDAADSHAIGVAHADILAVSSKGELAVRMRQGMINAWPFEPGTLARLPMGGGTPRELLENVVMADWGPNGEDLAVLRQLPNARIRLEYPIGSALYEAVPGCDFIRVSPTGDRIACEERAVDSDSGYTISTIDRKGNKLRLSSGWLSLAGLAWSPRGDGLLFIGGHTVASKALREVSLSGRERVLISNAADLWLDDVGPDGSLLLERLTRRHGMRSLSRGATAEREIGWLDRSIVRDISEDGSAVLFTERGEGADSKVGAYLRKTDGSPAIRLGDGEACSLSSDGRWALSLLTGPPPRELIMYPVGAGLPKKVPVGDVRPIYAFALPKGKGIFVVSVDGDKMHYSVVGPDGGKARAIPTEGLDIGHTGAVSPDGERFAYGSSDGKLKLAPIFEGSGSTVPGLVLERNDIVEQWSVDGRFVYLSRDDELPRPVDRVELSTGQRRPWRRLMPEDSTGVYWISQVLISPDGQSYAYSYTAAVASALYVVEGVK